MCRSKYQLFNLEEGGAKPPFCYMTPEGINTQYLKRRVKDLGGICRKCTWSGIAGAPDWLIAFPEPQCHAWVELKAPGKASRPLQVREQRILRQCGCVVFVCDSPESIDDALSALLRMQNVSKITKQNRMQEFL